MGWRLLVLPGLLLCFLMLLVQPRPVQAGSDAPAEAAAPLVIGSRIVHTFRAPLGAFSAAERAASARARILSAFDEGGAGWTSVRAQDPGVLVELDGRPMFLVVAGDAEKPGEGSAEQLANVASRALQTAWQEARERRNPGASGTALLRVLLALLLLALVLLAIWRATRWVRDTVTEALAARVQAIPDPTLARRISPIFLPIVSRSCVLLAWLISLLALFVFLTYGLEQFAYTRALGEGLLHALVDLLLEGLSSVAQALPGLFVAVLIFLAAWVTTQVSTEVFDHVASGRLKLGMLDAHTAPTTGHLVNACLWLFALAMAYPYLPGSQTEAFKGLSVMLGIMVSIGASGLLGQIASGVILVYTRALSLGEYVCIQESEGTVAEIGLFVTRLRTGLGAEIALPNSLVLGNVTRNYSRVTPGSGHVLETAVTIGYDTPWRQVHALLVEATQAVPALAGQAAPYPYVRQTDLRDSYVAYTLVVYVAARDALARAELASQLRSAIQDVFNRYGVQIMSPNYYEDPARPKIVPESDWYLAPARQPGPE
jgi:small-conductance mechanosensitive channel